VEKELEPLVAGLQLPRFQRHRVKQIIIGTYRLTNGDKRVKRLRKRADFYLSLFFLSRLERLWPAELRKTADFWHRQCRRWSPPANFPWLSPADFFADRRQADR